MKNLHPIPYGRRDSWLTVESMHRASEVIHTEASGSLDLVSQNSPDNMIHETLQKSLIGGYDKEKKRREYEKLYGKWYGSGFVSGAPVKIHNELQLAPVTVTQLRGSLDNAIGEIEAALKDGRRKLSHEQQTHMMAIAEAIAKKAFTAAKPTALTDITSAEKTVTHTARLAGSCRRKDEALTIAGLVNASDYIARFSAHRYAFHKHDIPYLIAENAYNDVLTGGLCIDKKPTELRTLFANTPRSHFQLEAALLDVPKRLTEKYPEGHPGHDTYGTAEALSRGVTSFVLAAACNYKPKKPVLGEKTGSVQREDTSRSR